MDEHQTILAEAERISVDVAGLTAKVTRLTETVERLGNEMSVTLMQIRERLDKRNG